MKKKNVWKENEASQIFNGTVSLSNTNQLYTNNLRKTMPCAKNQKPKRLLLSILERFLTQTIFRIHFAIMTNNVAVPFFTLKLFPLFLCVSCSPALRDQFIDDEFRSAVNGYKHTHTHAHTLRIYQINESNTFAFVASNCLY